MTCKKRRTYTKKTMGKRKRLVLEEEAKENKCGGDYSVASHRRHENGNPRKIFILGYYNHKNFGDDLFQQAFSKLLHPNRDQLFFVSLDSIVEHEVKQIAASANLVIFGGGDLLNEYFVDRLASIYERICHVPILAIGVGFPSIDQVHEKNLHMFNFVYSRTNDTKIQVSSCRLATHKKIIFGPDLVFALYNDNSSTNNNSSSTSNRRKKSNQKNKIAIVPSMDQISQDKLNWLRDWLSSSSSCTKRKKKRREAHDSADDDINDNDDNNFSSATIVDTFILDLELDKPPENIQQQQQNNIHYLSIPPHTNDTLSSIFASPYRCVITFKFHALVLAIFAKCPVLVNKYSFKCVDLVTRIFGNHAHALIFDGVPMIGNLIYIEEHRQELIECMQRYLSWTQIFFKHFDLCKLCIEFDTNTVSYGFMSKSNAHDKVACIPQTYRLNVNEISNNAPYHYGLKTKKFRVSHDDHTWLVHDFNQKTRLDRPFILYPDHRFAGSTHRFGWNFAIDSIESLHNRYTNCGIQLDTFLDASVDPELQREPYLYPWIGIVHHPLHLDPLYSSNCFANLIKTKFYQLSEPYCLGLITLSQHLKNVLKHVVTVPCIDVLTHPMPSPATQWSMPNWYSFNEISHGKRAIVSLGNWLRNVFTIYTLSYPNKCVVVAANILPPDEYYVYTHDPAIDPPLQTDCCGDDVDADTSSASAGSCPTYSDNKWIYFANCYLSDKSCFVTDIEQAGRPTNNFYQNQLETWASSVKPIGPLDTETYDAMLASSVVFLNLVDCSASNSVIECIMYNTPIIINRHPAVVEYLGDLYPLYYDTLDEAQVLMSDRNAIFEGYLYLQSMDKNRFKSETFSSQLRAIGARNFSSI